MKSNQNIPNVSNKNNSFFQSKWTYPIVGLILFGIIMIYFLPSLQEKSLVAHDHQEGIYSSYELVEHYKSTGEYANWAENMFSGMPSFQIWKGYHNLSSWLTEGDYDLYFFIAVLVTLSSIILFVSMKVHPIIVLIGGICIALSNFTIVSLMAGHGNKVIVMSLVPFTLGGIWLLFERRKYLLSLFIISLSISLQVRLNHVQITYFMMFLVGTWTLVNLIEWGRKKDIKHISICISILFLGIGLGAINNASQLLTTKEYSEETQRGGPSPVEIAKNQQQVVSDGVAYDYATAWSYGILETFTLLIPNFSGGPDVIKNVDENNEIAKVLINNGVPANNAIQVAQQLPTYWGNQPFVAGTTYIGAVGIFLMILGFFILKDQRRWWLLGSFIITLFVAWGNNFSAFYKLLFNYLPYFNKFRTPSMVFYLTTIIVAITACLTLQKLIQNAATRETLWDKFMKVTLTFIGFMIVIAILGPYIFSFISESVDPNIKAQLLQMTQNNSSLADAIYNGLLQERKSMMRSDAFRSAGLIIITAGLIASYLKRKLSPEIMLTGIAILVLIDIVGVDKRYVNYDSFKDHQTAGLTNINPTNADKLILQDNENYRVLDLTVSSFNESKPSVFHKNIGGYHSVKLKRYQDIISYQINENLKQFSQGNPSKANVLNMLNTRYLITSPEEAGVYKNEHAYGNAWLVNQVKVLDGPVAVFDNLMTENLYSTALLEKSSEHIAQNQSFQTDSSAIIQLIKSDNDEMKYNYQSSVPSYAVFSEIYYNSGKGWTAYIDGQQVAHDQVNYVLRGLSLPAGKHEIVFKFDTPTLQMANKIDWASSLLIVLLGLGVIVFPFIKRRKTNDTQVR